MSSSSSLISSYSFRRLRLSLKCPGRSSELGGSGVGCGLGTSGRSKGKAGCRGMSVGVTVDMAEEGESFGRVVDATRRQLRDVRVTSHWQYY